MKRWFFAALTSGLFILGFLSGFSAEEFSRWTEFFNRQKSLEPVTYTLKKAPFTIEVPAFGELEAVSSTSISVPQVRTGGLKVYWIVKNGTLVKKGDTLVEFDASDLLQQLQETENNLEATLRQLEMTVLRSGADTGRVIGERELASLELDKATQQAPRDDTIFSRNQIIEGQLSIALSETKVGELSGKVESKKQLNDSSQRILVIDRGQHENKQKLLKESLTLLKVLAPHDGLVLHHKEGWWMEQGTEIGDVRWPGMKILTIPDISSMKARVYVLESDAGNLKVGQKAVLTVDSHPDSRVEATVERIETLARPLEKDSPVKYFEAFLKIHISGNVMLRPGKLVRARITVARLRDTLTVPRSALVEENRKFFVWVQRQPASERRQVEVSLGDAARVSLVSGVREGESVLLNPPTESRPEERGSSSGTVSGPR